MRRSGFFEHTDVEDEQEDDQDAYSLELLVVLAIDDGVGLALLQLGEVVVECLLRIAGVVDVNILSTASLS